VSPPEYLPRALSLENYLKVYEYQAGLLSYLGNSMLVAALTILRACCSPFRPAMGWRGSRCRSRRCGSFLLAPLMIPYQALLTPLYLTLKWGLADSHRARDGAHYPATAVLDLPSMRNSFEAIPKEVAEACAGWMVQQFLPGADRRLCRWSSSAWWRWRSLPSSPAGTSSCRR